MDSMMTIRIRAVGNQAVKQLKALKGEIESLQSTSGVVTGAQAGSAAAASTKAATAAAATSNAKLAQSLLGMSDAEKAAAAGALGAERALAQYAVATQNAALFTEELAAAADKAAAATKNVGAAAGATGVAGAGKKKKPPPTIVGTATGAEAQERIRLANEAKEVKARLNMEKNQAIIDNEAIKSDQIRVKAAAEAAAAEAAVHNAEIKADAAHIRAQEAILRDQLTIDNAELKAKAAQQRADDTALRNQILIDHAEEKADAARIRAEEASLRSMNTINNAALKAEAIRLRGEADALKQQLYIDNANVAADAARLKAETAFLRNQAAINNAAATQQANALRAQATAQRNAQTIANAGMAAQAAQVRANAAAQANAATVAGAAAAAQAAAIRQAAAHQRNLNTIAGAAPPPVVPPLGRFRTALNAATTAAGQLATTMNNTFGSKMASQVQWVGRQLTYNFSMPLAIAAGVGVKMALDFEKAMVRLHKVYGDVSHGPQFALFGDKEVAALGKYFTRASEYFGIAREEIANIGADWAQAGASGQALAAGVQATLETMILGEMSSEEATKALISVQAQWGLSTQDTGKGVINLQKAMNILNMVENESAVSMSDLLDVFVRAGGSARTAGVSIRELAAFSASLVPSAGSAANAGNALKTIFSRLMAPTKEAAEVMGLMGINVQTAAWQSKTATERILAMAKATVGLTQNQKDVVASTISSRWQINRWSIMMEDLINPTGRYASALAATADEQKNFSQRQKELTEVLTSNPAKLAQAWQSIRNSLGDAITPLIPWIVLFVKWLGNLMKKFSELSPETQGLILAFLGFLIVLGPVVRLMGAFVNLVIILFKPIMWLWRGLGLLTRVLLGMSGILLKFSLMVSRIVGWLMIPFAKLFLWLTVTSGKVAVAIFKIVLITSTAILRVVGLMVLGIGKMLLSLSIFSLRIFGRMLIVILRSVITMGARIFGFFAPMVIAIGRVIGVVLEGLILFIARILGIAYRAVVVVFESVVLFLARIAGVAFRAILSFGGILVRGLMRFMGILFAVLVRIFPFLVELLPRVATFFLGIPGLIIGAILLIMQLFGISIGDAWNFIVDLSIRGIGFLIGILTGVPEFIAKVIIGAFKGFLSILGSIFKAIVTLVSKAVSKIAESLSNLNPFKRHSPSLVDVVTWGMAEIRKQYASVGDVGGVFAKAAKDLAAFKAAAGDMKISDFADDRTAVAEMRPSALPQFDTLVADVEDLKVVQDRVGSMMADQQVIVDQWKKQLDDANKVLKEQNRILNDLQANLGELQKAYDDASSTMSDLANAPLVGMGEMSDAIFSNQMEVKQLQLQMMDWEAVNGAIDDVRTRYTKLGDEIDTLLGMQNDLRAKGAGSEIMGPLQEQIDSLRAQREAMGAGGTGATTAYDEMQKKLDELNKAGQRLDLLNSIKFDPLTREVDKLANGMDEIPYNDVIKGIKEQRVVMVALKPKIDDATRAVDAQTAAVKTAQDAVDKIQVSYDIESEKLDNLTKQYNEVRDAISAVSDELHTMGSAAQAASKKAKDSLTPGGQNFLDAALGDFDTEGLQNQLDRINFDDQSAEIDKMLDDLSKSIENIDIFKPIKEAWNKFTAWLAIKWDEFKTWVSGIPGAVWGWIKDKASWVGDRGKEFIDWFTGGIKAKWEEFKTWVSNIPEKVWNWIKDRATWVGDRGKEFIDWFTGGIKSRWEEFKTWVSSLPQRFWDWIKDKWRWMGDRGREFIGWLGDGMVSKFEEFKTWIQGLPGKIWAWLVEKAQWVRDRGREFVGWLNEGFSAKLEDLRIWFRDLPAKVLAWIMEKYNDVKEIGRRIVTGIVEGIKEGAKAIARGVLSVLPTPKLNPAGTGWVAVAPADLTPATGGLITGPGSGTSDSIPARLSNGEYVIKASATRRNLKLLQAINSDSFNQSDLQAIRVKAAHGGYMASNRSTAPAGSGSFGQPVGISIHNENTTVNFTGDLILPGVKDGSDAQSLVDGLYALAKGR